MNKMTQAYSQSHEENVHESMFPSTMVMQKKQKNNNHPKTNPQKTQTHKKI